VQTYEVFVMVQHCQFIVTSVLHVCISFQGGKDAASPRYIFTKLSNITRSIFPKDDDILLNYLNEDGQSIEPTW
jgi:predicted phosphoadenosine phosphosulfate sulfurtransferase